MEQLVYVFMLAAFISGLFKTGFGFGAGVVLNPILAFMLPASTAVSMLAPILWYSNVDGARTHARKADWLILRTLFPLAIAGTIAGAAMLVILPDEWLKKLMGGMAIVLLSLSFFKSKKKPKSNTLSIVNNVEVKLVVSKPPSRFYRHTAAFLSGFAGSTANSGGLPLTFLFLHEKMAKQHFTANLVVLLAVMDTIKIISYLALGIVSLPQLLQAVLYLPFIFLGGIVGKQLNKILPDTVFFSVIYILVFVIGVMLLL